MSYLAYLACSADMPILLHQSKLSVTMIGEEVYATSIGSRPTAQVPLPLFHGTLKYDNIFIVTLKLLCDPSYII